MAISETTQGSVLTLLRCGEILSDDIITNFFSAESQDERVMKLVSIRQKYMQQNSGTF